MLVAGDGLADRLWRGRTPTACKVDTCVSAQEALRAMEAFPYDAVLASTDLTDDTGIALVVEMQRRWSDVPVVLIARGATVAGAVDDMKAGAADFLLEPLAPDALDFVVAKTLESARRVAVLPPETAEPRVRFLAASQSMREVEALLRRATLAEAWTSRPRRRAPGRCTCLHSPAHGDTQQSAMAPSPEARKTRPFERHHGRMRPGHARKKSHGITPRTLDTAWVRPFSVPRAPSKKGKILTSVELQYASNVITRRRGDPQQDLSFCLLVENRAYDKTVTVHWAGEDGAWHTLSAGFVAKAGANRERWAARATFSRESGEELPGNVRFAVQVRMAGRDDWDNRGGSDYRIEADAGVMLGPRHELALLEVVPVLPPDLRWLAVNVAVSRRLDPREVFVEWTDDRWRRTHHAALSMSGSHWDRENASNARNPNQYGTRVFHGRIRIRDARRIELLAGCHTADGTVWDNNLGANHVFHRGAFRVLTLNLHCYQETDQDAKLSLIARAIDELDIDVVCLQEVAENWNGGNGDWGSNAARIICERVRGPYHLFADWSHRGFDRYREGVAILSKYPFVRQDSRYVSASRDPNDIHARKVVMARVDVPAAGQVNVYSAHLSWWSDGFREQWDTLAGWAGWHANEGGGATLMCGDFNVKAGSEGYRHAVDSSDFEDQVLQARNREAFDAVFRWRESGWPGRLRDDGRIDFLWLKRGSALQVVDARPVFTDRDYGRVSDHEGYLATFEPK